MQQLGGGEEELKGGVVVVVVVVVVVDAAILTHTHIHRHLKQRLIVVRRKRIHGADSRLCGLPRCRLDWR